MVNEKAHFVKILLEVVKNYMKLGTHEEFIKLGKLINRNTYVVNINPSW